MTPAEEIATAVAALRSSAFIGVRYSTSTIAALLRARSPLAAWLETTAYLHEAHVPGSDGQTPPGCQWCADEDFPCADMRHALAAAREINGPTP